ncbi:MAG: hypothetical protein C4522_02700 [Desulfobacteraceae bacterium]|nr:MAG: hypothetical protein C4522_02700 [Desulfobacteraceae bacterium]
MTKLKQKIDTHKQLDIFDFIKQNSKPRVATEGKYKIIDALRKAIRENIKTCPLSRHQIAGQMSHFLDESISKEMIDSWTRQSDELNGRTPRHIPAEYLPAFCYVTGSCEPIKILGHIVGLFVMPGEEALRAEIQRLDEEAKQIQAEKKKRMLFLKEMEK